MAWSGLSVQSVNTGPKLGRINVSWSSVFRRSEIRTTDISWADPVFCSRVPLYVPQTTPDRIGHQLYPGCKIWKLLDKNFSLHPRCNNLLHLSFHRGYGSNDFHDFTLSKSDNSSASVDDTPENSGQDKALDEWVFRCLEAWHLTYSKFTAPIQNNYNSSLISLLMFF